MNQNTQSRSGTDWERAPRDGSLINVEFSSGDVVQARWDFSRNQWQVPQFNANLVALHDERTDPPQDWWPEI